MEGKDGWIFHKLKKKKKYKQRKTKMNSICEAQSKMVARVVNQKS
jgi:hypothetical protein